MPVGKKGFVKGQSGNPKGRPKGALNKNLLIGRLNEHKEELFELALAQARSGKRDILIFFLERLLPLQRFTEVIEGYNAENEDEENLNRTIQQYADGDIGREKLDGIMNAIQKKISVVKFEKAIQKIDALWDAKQKREGSLNVP